MAQAYDEEPADAFRLTPPLPAVSRLPQAGRPPGRPGDQTISSSTLQGMDVRRVVVEGLNCTTSLLIVRTPSVLPCSILAIWPTPKVGPGWG